MRSPIEVVAPARLGTSFRWLLGATWVSNIGDGSSGRSPRASTAGSAA